MVGNSSRKPLPQESLNIKKPPITVQWCSWTPWQNSQFNGQKSILKTIRNGGPGSAVGPRPMPCAKELCARCGNCGPAKCDARWCGDSAAAAVGCELAFPGSVEAAE